MEHLSSYHGTLQPSPVSQFRANDDHETNELEAKRNFDVDLGAKSYLRI